VPKSVHYIGIISLLGVGLTACVRAGETRTDALKIDLGEAKSAVVEMRMSAGELSIQGGAQALAEGTFTYTVNRWKPEVDYHVFNNQGRLSIEQRRRGVLFFGRQENKWDLRINDRVPLEFKLKFGAGEGNLDFRGLSLTSLGIDMGVGELKLDLSGERKENLDVRIKGGVGEGTIYLPEGVGVRAKVKGGIGSVHAGSMHKDGDVYTNDAYGKTAVSINLSVEAGIGSINLKLR
jgi:hypothetical protein